MIAVKEIYDAVAKDSVNSAENGDLSFEKFNRLSKAAEIRILDYISGDIENLRPPAPYTSQKVKDHLSFLITPFPKAVSEGKIIKPIDFYGFENISMVGDFSNPEKCGEGEEGKEKCNTPIELVDGKEFTKRCKSYIKRKRPSFTRPIAKMVGDTFEFSPKDIGNVVLEYIRYPKFARIVSKKDEEYNDVVVDEKLSTNYEYGEWATELLKYFITRGFATGTREDSVLQHTQITGKLVRDEK